MSIFSLLFGVASTDLKPDNVLVSEYLGCKVSDFGTSRVKDAMNMNMTTVRLFQCKRS